MGQLETIKLIKKKERIMNNNQLLDFLNTAKAQMDRGEYANALKTLESALECNPEPWLKTEIYFQEALCKCELKDYDGAADNLETALTLSGNAAYAEKKHIYDILCIVYTFKPDYTKLADLCGMLIGLEEDKSSLASSLIYAYLGLKKWDELARIFDEYPDIEMGAKTLLCKNLCFIMTGRYKEAFQAADQYMKMVGEDHEIFTNLMFLYYKIGDGNRGFEYYKKAIKLCADPQARLTIGSKLLWMDLYSGAIGDNELPDIVNEMRRSTEKLQVNTTFNNTLKPFKKIKIGYLSSDFRRHPVGFFLLPVMMRAAASHCLNFCFNLAKPPDKDDLVTTHFKSLADRWEEVYERPDSYIEQLFLTNEIDIAFDVMCHTDNNRLPLYARRLAPVQISWIGSPVTSGVAAMDYVITDKNADPPGSEKYYTEKLLYMPESFLCTPLSGNPQVEPPAFTCNGYITFACFHNLMKISDESLRYWCAIIKRCANSRLKIMGRLPDSAEGREILDERFVKIGIPMDCVSISPPVYNANDYFAAYNDVDIMLDTYPFSGATTTFDALRMGRPIITLVGERHVTRVGYSLLKHVGLEDLAAFSEDEYIEKAVTLAGDFERLRKINIELPRRVEESPLVNQPAFREHFEKIIRDVWVKHCFENRECDYDYGADNPRELLEQVVNATIYMERKMDADETIDGTLATEYLGAQKAFLAKLSFITNDTEFVRDYEKLVGAIERGIDEKNPGPAILMAKQRLNSFSSRDTLKETERAFDEFSGIDLDGKATLRKIRGFAHEGRYNEAFQSAREYMERFGEDHLIFTNLMDLCYNVGKGKKGFEYYKKAIALCDNPAWRLSAGSILLSKDAYQGAISDCEFPGIVNDIRRNTEKLQSNTVFDNTPKPFRRINIGYLSNDFKQHPVGFFLSPVMTQAVSSHCFNFCFNLDDPSGSDDPITAHFKSHAHKWDEVHGCSDSHIERLFLANKIDIAFDTMGHTVNNRLPMYARRLAPVQVSWIGFPVTTCVAAMDYVLTDKDVDPTGSEKYYTEKLLYMPECFLCYTVESGLPVEPPAFMRNGYITFACFHNLIKVTDNTLRMWRGVLERCESSRLKIMGHMPAGQEYREIFDERIGKAGLPVDRVTIYPPCPMKDYLAVYNDVDIMLDTHPFSGATTTFDALRMGRPIITLVGERHVARVSYSLLKHVGLEDLAALSEDEYIEKAVTLANNHERLRKINIELPRRVEESPLVNQSAFRKNFEKIIRDVWVKYCFENRIGNYDYSADSPRELFEQVVNATVYMERKMDADETIDGTLATEYLGAQKAFLAKLSFITNDTEFVRDYEKLVGAIERGIDEKNPGPAILMAKQRLNAFHARDKTCLSL